MSAWLTLCFLTGLIFLLGWATFRYAPAIGRNPTFGFRIPWAMQSDENWRVANRKGGKAPMLAGLGIPMLSIPVFPFVDPGMRGLVVTAAMVFGVSAAILWTQSQCR